MKKIFALLFLLISANQVCLAQSIKVVDKTTLQPLVGVVISSTDGSSSSVLTNTKGQAYLNKQLQDAPQLHFSYVGYQNVIHSLKQLQESNYVVMLTQQTHNLNEVVVSVGKFSMQQKLVPQQVEVLSKKDLDFLSQPTTADVMQQNGKVLVQKSQLGGGSPIIRGFEANKVLLVIDGVRMNNAIYRGGHLQNIITLDNSMLERAEVVFGPSSVIYGSDALGGVLHFHTLQPKLAGSENKKHISGTAFTRYASASNEKTVNAQLNYGTQNWVSLTSITASDFDDLRQGSSRKDTYGDLGIRKYFAARHEGRDTMLVNSNQTIQRPSGYGQLDVLQKFLFQANTNTAHTLNLQLSTSTNIPRYDRLSEFTRGQLRFAEWYYGPQERFLASYTLGLRYPTQLYDEAKIIVAYQRLQESRHTRRFGRNLRSNQVEQVQVFSLNSDFDKRLKQHRLQYGIETNYNSVDSKATLENITNGLMQPQSTRYPDGGSAMHSAAAYITHTWDLKPWLVLNQGLRYSYVGLDAEFNDKTFFPFLADEVQQRNHAISGNTGIVLFPGEGWRFSMLGSTGFRAPNVDDLSKVFDSMPGTVIVPNADLKPEYTYNLEASISKSIKERLHLDFTSYYSWYRNAIITQPVLFKGQDSIVYNGQLSRVTANVNAGKAYLYGYTASLKADITSYLNLSSSFNYTYGRILKSEGDTPLDHIPPLFGRTSLNLQVKRLRAEFSVLYNGAKKLEDYNVSGEDNLHYATPEGMPAWYTLNLRTAYQFTPNVQLQAALENVTDRYYRVFASGISAPGRNIVLTLRGKF